jgi:ABC-type uncharacterized transport system permease subunit
MMKIIFAQCFLNNTDLFESAHGSESSDIWWCLANAVCGYLNDFRAIETAW